MVEKHTLVIYPDTTHRFCSIYFSHFSRSTYPVVHLVVHISSTRGSAHFVLLSFLCKDHMLSSPYFALSLPQWMHETEPCSLHQQNVTMLLFLMYNPHLPSCPYIIHFLVQAHKHGMWSWLHIWCKYENNSRVHNIMPFSHWSGWQASQQFQLAHYTALWVRCYIYHKVGTNYFWIFPALLSFWVWRTPSGK